MKNNDKQIAVLIPSYNEEQTLEKVILDCKKYLPQANIYVYDNNSTDSSVSIALKNKVIVRYELKQGKGNVVRSMFRDIQADCYLMVDADDTYSLSKAQEMCNYVLNNNIDMVIGDRLSTTYFKKNNRLFHSFGNRFIRFMVNLLFRSKISDVLTGYRAFSNKFVKTFPCKSDNFEVETEMTIYAINNNYKILELPVEYRNRPVGSKSKLNTYEDGFKVYLTVIKLFLSKNRR